MKRMTSYLQMIKLSGMWTIRVSKIWTYSKIVDM